ncbi:MAG: IPT/TIG domain-containing protein [Candidatus Eisenbacteria bacterium]|nr:IPT/TIG domain-containing protein [Candidatus Eisenbacteria bacterium]
MFAKPIARRLASPVSCFLASLLVTLPVLFSACSSREEVPTDPGGDEPLDSITATVDETGGVVALEDGTAVVFPAGAVSAPLDVTLAKLEPSTWFEGTGEQEMAVVRTTAAVSQFQENVEIRFPLPEGMSTADSSGVMIGVIDEESGAVEMETSRVRMIDGAPFAVVETNHFTSRLCEWFFGQDPPASALLSVPYFNQGSSPYCWAVTVQTVTQAVNYQDLRSAMDVIGAAGIDEQGISDVGYRTNSAIASIVKYRTGVAPTRKLWDYVNNTQMRDYLWREIGVNHHPVGLFVGKWSHAVTVVGYDGSTFKIHDPASVSTGQIGYTSKAWNEFVDGMDIGDKLVTMVVSKPLSTSNERITASWLPDAFEFTKPRYGEDMPAIYRYQWDYREEDGYSLRNPATDEVADPLPGEVEIFRVNGDLQLANSSRTASTDVGVYVDITALGDPPSGVGRLSTYHEATLGPNSTKTIHLDDTPVDEFRYNTSEEEDYVLSAIVRVGGNTVDWQSVEFSIAPVVPEITSVTPSTAAVGDQVTIRGTKLGYLPKNNEILFNGTTAVEVVSWADNNIVVVVPEGATTGPLKEKRGEVDSNTVDFTVSETTTLSGSVGVSYGDEVIDHATITVTGTWTLQAEGAVLDYYIPETRHYSWYVRKDAPGSLELSFSASIAPSEVTMDSGGKIVFQAIEWEYTTTASGSSFPWSESGSDGSNSLSFTVQTFDDLLCSNPYFAVYGDVYDAEGNLVASRAFLNGRTAAVFCVKPQ